MFAIVLFGILAILFFGVDNRVHFPIAEFYGFRCYSISGSLYFTSYGSMGWA